MVYSCKKELKDVVCDLETPDCSSCSDDDDDDDDDQDKHYRRSNPRKVITFSL